MEMQSKGARALRTAVSPALIIAALAALLASALPFDSVAAAPPQVVQNDTSNLVLSLLPTYVSLSVYLSFDGDDNGNNQTLLEYRQAGASTWVKGMGMTADRRSVVGQNSTPNLWKNQWRASILNVQPGTEYEVRVTISDPDGAPVSPLTSTVRTWEETDQIISTGSPIYVATSGDDLGGDGSEPNPYQTIQRAANVANPGDTVYVKAGTYTASTPLAINTSGVPGNFITFRNFGTDRVIIDSGGIPSVDITASYIRFKGFEIAASVVSVWNTGIKINKGSHDLIIEDNLLEVRGGRSIGIFVASDVQNPVSKVTYQRNRIHLYQPTNITTKAEVVGPGIDTWEAGGQFVLRGNHIEFFGTYTADVHGRDCIAGHPNHKPTGGYWDSDIYDNTCLNATDDAISLDGGNANVRVWNNHISGSKVGISIAGVIVGPAFIFRNVIDNLQNHWQKSCVFFKMGEGGTGHVYIYHNTFYATDRFLNPLGKGCSAIRGLSHGAPPIADNIFSLNNIWIYNGLAVRDKGDKPTMDYNLYFGDPENSKAFGEWDQIGYSTLQDFQSGTGQEQHGVYGQPTFVDRLNGDYRLMDGSLGIDSGTAIQGFNDLNSLWPFQGAAPDMGAFESQDADPNAPPLRFNSSPSGVLDPGTTSTTLSLQTAKPATCRYSPTAGTAYDSMVDTFQSTGNLVHTTSVGGLVDGNSYEFYVRCSAVTANPDDLLISFSIRALDSTPPVLSGLAAAPADTSAQITWSTDDSSDALVEYGVSSLDQSASDAALNTSHSIGLSGLTSGTTYLYRVTSCNADALCGSSAVASFTTTSPPPRIMAQIPMRVNVGGSDTTDSNGNSWTADGAFDAAVGWGYVDADANTGSIDRRIADPTLTIAGTAEQDIYTTERWDMDGYAIEVADGSYDLTLMFAETWSGIGGAGVRVFDVFVEGTRVLAGLDVYAEVGLNAALRKYILGVQVADGQLNVDFQAVSNKPILNGLLVLPAAKRVTLPGQSGPARDLDGDGRAEDINGNGRLDFADVVTFYHNLNAPEVIDNAEMFDFDGSGVVDLQDVAALFTLLAG